MLASHCWAMPNAYLIALDWVSCLYYQLCKITFIYLFRSEWVNEWMNEWITLERFFNKSNCLNRLTDLSIGRMFVFIRSQLCNSSFRHFLLQFFVFFCPLCAHFRGSERIKRYDIQDVLSYEIREIVAKRDAHVIDAFCFRYVELPSKISIAILLNFGLLLRGSTHTEIYTYFVPSNDKFDFILLHVTQPPVSSFAHSVDLFALHLNIYIYTTYSHMYTTWAYDSARMETFWFALFQLFEKAKSHLLEPQRYSFRLIIMYWNVLSLAKFIRSFSLSIILSLCWNFNVRKSHGYQIVQIICFEYAHLRRISIRLTLKIIYLPKIQRLICQKVTKSKM